MKCSCNDAKCKGEINFDSASGFIIAEGKDEVIGLYLDVAGAVALARHLKAFVVGKMDEPLSNFIADNKDDFHD